MTGYSITPDRQFIYRTVKYDLAGSLLWQAPYSFAPGPNYAKGVAVDKAGNAYVTGYSYGNSGNDYATIKYDSAGNQLWVARYNGSNTLDDYGRAVAVDPAGNVIVTGSSLLPNYRYEAVTIKYDANGQQLWVAHCPEMGQSYLDPQPLAVDALGNIYVAGQSLGEHGISDYAIAKYDTNGVLLWLARYQGPANAQDTLTSIKVDSAGNVYVTGTSVIDCNPPGTDYLICYKRGLVTVKFNPQGSQLWATRYQVPAEGTGAAAALSLDSSNNVYITGSIDEPDGTSDYLTLKYNANGDQVWMATYNGPGNGFDTAAALAVDGNGHVYVTGSSSGDFATLKYIPTNAPGSPRLTLRPRNQQVYQGSNITFRVSASGTAPLSYQWRKNGEIIDGAMGTSLTLPNAQWSDVGDYSVIVSNLAGCTVSPEGRLVVLYPPLFVREPLSQTVESGSHVLLDAEVISPQPVSYQWQYSGIDIPHATNTTLVLSNVQPQQTGPYALIASNAYGVASAVAWLTVLPGSRVWEAFYHASSYEEAKAVAVDPAGNVYVTGYSANEFATIKYDASGNQLWVARYNGADGGYDSAIKVAVDASGSVYVLGSSRPTNGPAVFVTVKYDADGNQLWVAPYNGPGSLANDPVDLALDGAGNVYVTGTSTGPSGFEDYTTIKYDATGHQLWVARYNSPENNAD
ncbi:MAG TPA: SBBP repeat-containing protein, partial [Candidatus Sulfotelmatobacter sp.]|nr:SBBP repeat-containing protein [Candidatus Sulfotelmatobacter sp.]